MLDLMKAVVDVPTPSGLETKEFFFRSLKDTYEEVGALVGVVEATDEERINPPVKVEELQGRGLVFRLSCTLEDGSVRQVLCSRNRLLAALNGDLLGVDIEGNAISSVIISRKAKFS